MPSRNRPITVLLVEDHSLVRRALRRVLEDEPDLRVVGEASDGLEAIRTARRLRPDVVVMDLALPGATGGAATESILNAVPGTAVLILSMHSEPIYIRAALDAGARGYLLKSAVDMELPEAVRKVASGQKAFDSRVPLPSPDCDGTTRPLTPREIEVLRLVVQGKSHHDIAVALGIRANTVRVHRANIMRALAIHSRVKLTLYAIARGLVGTA